VPAHETVEAPAVTPQQAAAPTAPSLAPTTAPAVTAPPPGYDPTLAGSLAHDLNRHLLAKVKADGARAKWTYDRKLTARFQTAAGIDSDGLYGGGTRGALIYYGQSNAPAPFFDPKATVLYRPPGGVA